MIEGKSIGRPKLKPRYEDQNSDGLIKARRNYVKQLGIQRFSEIARNRGKNSGEKAGFAANDLDGV